LSVFAGNEGWTANTDGGPPNSAMWLKSLTGSNGNFEAASAGAITCEAMAETTSV
jgi:hypothetical protein